MLQLLRYAKDYRKQIILGPFFKFLEAVFELILPLFMARLVDEGIARHDQGKVIEMTVAMLGLSIVGLLCALISNKRINHDDWIIFWQSFGRTCCD